MKTEIIWKLEKLPPKFASHIESTKTCEYYTLGDFPGLIVYYPNERKLTYIDNRNQEIDDVKIVISIISLWVKCIPDQIKINEIYLT